MSTAKEFPCTLDRMAKIISGITLIGIPALVVFYLLREEGSVGAGFWVFITMPIVVPMFSLPFSPLAFGADRDGVWIKRRIGVKKISHAEIIDVRLPEENEMRGAIRTFGNGGLFGYTGYYRNSKVGSMLWYCTRRSNYVLVVRASGPVVVITPDDPDGFVAHYRSVNAA